jgi:hypothetical protein
MSEYLQDQRQRSLGFSCAPTLLVEFLERHVTAIGLGASGNHVSGIVTNHVTAGNPRRHCEYLTLWIRLIDRYADFVEMCGRVFWPDSILV